MSVLVNGIAIELWNKNNISFVSNINVTKYISMPFIIATKQKKLDYLKVKLQLYKLRAN